MVVYGGRAVTQIKEINSVILRAPPWPPDDPRVRKRLVNGVCAVLPASRSTNERRNGHASRLTLLARGSTTVSGLSLWDPVRYRGVIRSTDATRGSSSIGVLLRLSNWSCKGIVSGPDFVGDVHESH